MFDVFDPLRSLVKIDRVCIDNNVFRLHYKATVIFLVAFSLLITSRQYIGDPIDCIVEGVPASIMDTYCWIHSTFTIPNRVAAVVGVEVPHPGVHTGFDEDKKYHKYYQWVCFFLFFQAAFFYIPRYLWKTWEGGKLKMLVLDLNSPIIDEDVKNERKQLLIDYFTSNLHGHNFYAIKFFFCELLNFINVVGQIYFMDTFLGNEFTTYGSDVVKFTEQEPEDRIDPMALVFPKVTKCTFHKYGPSGTVQKFDGLCVLPVNIVNEKIMIFLWFWFIIVAVLTGAALIYRVAVVMLGSFRLYLLRARSRLADPGDIQSINDKFQIGDWWVLYQMSKNMDPMIYREFTSDLAGWLKGNIQ